MTLTNTGHSDQAANFVTEIFGHPFKKGDIPAATYPEFQLMDGTACPYSMGALSTWSDGSLKFASFMLRVPASVGGNGSVIVKVLNNGPGPGTSGRALSNFADQDLKISIVGLENLTGTWVSSLNQGIADNDDVKVWMD